MAECFKPGFCFGTQISGELAMSTNECLERCQEEPQCNYFNYNEDKYCALTSDCVFVDSSCVTSNGCIYGEHACYMQEEFVLITAGFTLQDGELNGTETVDLDTFMSCPVAANDFPNRVSFPVSLRDSENNIMVCGGEYETTQVTVYQECFKYLNGSWTPTVSMLQPRVGATSVEIKPKEWLILGGQDDTTYYNTTELFKDGAFGVGPPLPEPMFGGSAVMYNATHLFTAMKSQTNYFLDIDTYEWTKLADRVAGGSGLHVSGIFANDITEAIEIATIGKNGIEIYSPESNTWNGMTSPLLNALEGASAIQIDTRYFLTFGGLVNSIPVGSIYRFDGDGLSLVEEDAMTTRRFGHIAAMIKPDQIDCY